MTYAIKTKTRTVKTGFDTYKAAEDAALDIASYADDSHFVNGGINMRCGSSWETYMIVEA